MVEEKENPGMTAEIAVGILFVFLLSAVFGLQIISYHQPETHEYIEQ